MFLAVQQDADEARHALGLLGESVGVHLGDERVRDALSLVFQQTAEARIAQEGVPRAVPHGSAVARLHGAPELLQLLELPVVADGAHELQTRGVLTLKHQLALLHVRTLAGATARRRARRLRLEAKLLRAKLRHSRRARART